MNNNNNNVLTTSILSPLSVFRDDIISNNRKKIFDQLQKFKEAEYLIERVDFYRWWLKWVGG